MANTTAAAKPISLLAVLLAAASVQLATSLASVGTAELRGVIDVNSTKSSQTPQAQNQSQDVHISPGVFFPQANVSGISKEINTLPASTVFHDGGNIVGETQVVVDVEVRHSSFASKICGHCMVALLVAVSSVAPYA
mmetsp:Transcript_10056/g.22594  ORF Transcript_10056/g.22594 Transcript_10056/m.22594 type:complete len:137 (-) Transcript_10056:25-435(-)